MKENSTEVPAFLLLRGSYPHQLFSEPSSKVLPLINSKHDARDTRPSVCHFINELPEFGLVFPKLPQSNNAAPVILLWTCFVLLSLLSYLKGFVLFTWQDYGLWYIKMYPYIHADSGISSLWNTSTLVIEFNRTLFNMLVLNESKHDSPTEIKQSTEEGVFFIIIIQYSILIIPFSSI